MVKYLFYCLAISIAIHTTGQEYPINKTFPDYSYDEVADRINCIENEVPLVFNERVKAFIDYFAIKNREYTADIIRKKELYFPIFEEILAKYHMPDELKYLAIVESGLRADAVSRANAVGLWQFISSTGKIYGLKGDWYIDDRIDPYKATDAAVRHLKDLYNMFGSWELALASYNCGPGNVRKAIRRSGYKKDFWEIYTYLPRETRSYVPQYVAITYLFNHLDEHGFIDRAEQFYPDFDTLLINQYFHLETFCNQINACIDDMILWNPQIKRGALPEGTTNFALRVPKDLKDTIVSNRIFLYDTASKVGKEHLEYLARNTPGSTYGRDKIYYKVRSGDVLGTIARQYNVRVSDLRAWNNLQGNLIRVGQRLNIWVLPTYNSQTKNLYTASTDTNETDNTSRSTSSQSISPGNVYYVKSGDSLWSISKNNNTTIEKLKQTNKLSTSRLMPGQQLVIPN